MTLRELAEKEARVADVMRGHDECDRRLRPPQRCPCCDIAEKRIADAIERVARRFAERACREVWDEASNDGANMIHADDRGYSYKRIDRNETIAEAIAAAERGE